MEKKNKQLNPDDNSLKALQDPNSALEEAIESDDIYLFFLAFKELVRVKGMSLEEGLDKLNRESMYKMFSRNGRPEFGSIWNLLVTYILRKQYDYVGNPTEGWYLVRKGNVFEGKFGFVYMSLDRAIDAKFEMAYPFMNEIALVNHSGDWNYVSNEGEFVFDFVYPRFENGGLSNCSDFTPVRKNGRWGVMGKHNTLVIPILFDEPVQVRQIGIYLKKLEPQDQKWTDIEGNVFTSIPIDKLNERLRYTDNKTLQPEPHGFLWHCLDVVTGWIGKDAYSEKSDRSFQNYPTKCRSEAT